MLLRNLLDANYSKSIIDLTGFHIKILIKIYSTRKISLSPKIWLP